jgi:hypothetical protein
MKAQVEQTATEIVEAGVYNTANANPTKGGGKREACLGMAGILCSSLR